MTKREAISLLKEVTFNKKYQDALDIVIEAAESTIPYKSKWVISSNMGEYYHNGCKAKCTLPPDDTGGVYRYFKRQYRFCPDCGEAMFVREEVNQ